jgi:hypothetical protein
MAETSDHLIKKNFDRPDETRTYEQLQIDIVRLGNLAVSRNTYRPGWSWAENMEPRARTSGCQTEHTFYVVSGRIRLKTEGGEEREFGPGDLGLAPAGHQAWTVGSESAEVIDFGGCMCTYGERL